MNGIDVGQKLWSWAKDLFPINRSLTGDGVRETLGYIKDLVPGLNLKFVDSGYEAFDWIVPNEWNCSEAYIEDEKGNRLIDFSENNLHVLGYSVPVDAWFDKSELEKHLYSLPEYPSAIPYVTSYYKKNWGFCLSQNARDKIQDGRYRAVIKSTHEPGRLDYGDVVIPATSSENDDEILISTYICHPSMANNELSGPVVAIGLIQWLLSLEKRQYNYRFVFVPETIGSIVYISKHLDELKNKVKAGFVLTCIGDEGHFSMLYSRQGNTLSDRVGLAAVKSLSDSPVVYSWLERGSDERQYCAPGVDLPIASLMRTKYGVYEQYHTSLDNLEFVTQKGLAGGYKLAETALFILENNVTYKAKFLCEPQLGRRGLYPTISSLESARETRDMMNVLSYCDGSRDLIDLSVLLKLSFEDCFSICLKLERSGVVEVVR